MFYRPSSTSRRSSGPLKQLREALSGTHHDFTQGSISRGIVLLAIPMVLEMLMQSVFELVDIFFVSRLGADAVAAVGITASLLIFVFAIGIGLSMAVSAMVARRIGEKNPAAASATVFQAIVMAIALSIPIAGIGLAFAPELLRFMGAGPEVVASGTTYCMVLFGSNFSILLLILINSTFRGAGDASLAMRALAFSNLINIILDPLLIFGIGPFPELGVVGAAVATVTGRFLGVCYQISLLVRGTGRLHLTREVMRLQLDIIKRILRISGPGILQYLVGSASWVVIIRLVATFGSAAVAGYTIGIRIILFALLPSWGMGNAAATLVGQNLGARRPERAERAVWITGFANAAFLTAVGVLLIWFDRTIMHFFTREEAVVAVGSELLVYAACAYPFMAFGTVMVQAFNGAGDTTTPTWINLFVYWIFQLPLAYVLAKLVGMDVRGIFVSITIAQITFSLVGVWFFRRGLWKLKVI